ncbi:uncharacterized protein L969DRAFT_92622 [Mixia osmundae IAM 14324]|uniref:DNA replication complex GINS protein PSF2 n=1 Tax=Mixia osmundae (strain CBS 9802 / IAM 14324 / JCM 22182 / KY 12970) TaxID=764103 RepID=G7DY30_MIXOS|nr:uncharacterized protein L969DRAFT_92622 [Mixia osmundae IAM 14324]KEI41392.1 hypothetical protein L969DRAFT_92622 [Mixia osmundae IAM 14324]GAA95490.1 hypothetical protein E5Q_02145 [Mixia osmundae IAM 14324]
MSLPRALQGGFAPSELQFGPEQDVLVEIVPLFRMQTPFRLTGKLNGKSRTVGPFEPPRRARIPLWLAVTLKRKRKCRIVAPPWMLLEKLEELLREDTTSLGFSALPFCYMEISRVLLEVASDDIPDAARIRMILKDLREVRQSKTRRGVEAINTTHLEMTNISQLELNEIRPFFTLAMKRMIALDPGDPSGKIHDEL